MAEFTVHTAKPAHKFEWYGLTILKRYLANQGVHVEDVHSNPQYFPKGIDLVLHDATGIRTVDVKVDSYYGSDPNRKIRGLCNPDSKFILFETISQLQYDRQERVDVTGNIPARIKPDVPGWFFTEQADEVYYYYLALLNEEGELSPIHAEYLARINESTTNIENKLLRTLKVDRDLLVSFRLNEARKWFNNAPTSAFKGYAPAPNPTYLTLSRKAYRDQFISNGPGKSHGSIFSDALSTV